jgi:tetratricopeptide (TPR) repeat protein
MSAEEKKTQVTTAEPAKPKGSAAIKEKPTETSMLGQRLLELWNRVKQGESRLTWYILGGVAAVVIGFFVWRYFAGLAKARDSERDRALFTISDRVQTVEPDNPRAGPMSEDEKQVKVLEDFIKENEGKAQARYARFLLARLYLNRGLRGLRAESSPGRPNARRGDIQRAAELYEKLIADASDVPLLLQEALLNAGKARETLGEIDEAKKHYERLVNEKELKESYAAKAANELLKRINDPEGLKEIKRLAAELNR